MGNEQSNEALAEVHKTPKKCCNNFSTISHFGIFYESEESDSVGSCHPHSDLRSLGTFSFSFSPKPIKSSKI